MGSFVNSDSNGRVHEIHAIFAYVKTTKIMMYDFRGFAKLKALHI